MDFIMMNVAERDEIFWSVAATVGMVFDVVQFQEVSGIAGPPFGWAPLADTAGDVVSFEHGDSHRVGDMAIVRW